MKIQRIWHSEIKKQKAEEQIAKLQKEKKEKK